jgi:hypothetical protein
MSRTDFLSSTVDERANGRVLACVLMLVMLAWPAVWNGFPIVFPDTGGYLARPFEETLATGRAAIYGAFLLLGIKFQFWPNVVIQAGLIAWLILLMLRLHGFGHRHWLAAAIMAGLCALTGLPWYAAQLMPDILVPAAVLAVALLAFYAEDLRRWELAVLVGVVAAAIASHMSILALVLAIVAVLGVVRLLGSRVPLPRPRVLLPATAIAAGALLALLSNFVITKQLAFTPGGFNFVFSRLVQDRIVDRYLKDHCPDATIRLCKYRDDVPETANRWLWALDSPIHKLGGLKGYEPEARLIVIESLALYPLMHLETAIVSAVKQFVRFATGDGLTPWAWYTRLTFERFAPGALHGYITGRQATSSFDFSWINLIHVPVQALAIAGLPIIMLTRSSSRISAFAALVLTALLANAAICGVLSNPHDRYQSRLAWLATLVVAIALLEQQPQTRQRQTGSAGTPAARR